MELYLVASFFAVKSNAPINIIQSPNKYLLSTRVPYNELDSGDLDVNKTAKISSLSVHEVLEIISNKAKMNISFQILICIMREKEEKEKRRKWLTSDGQEGLSEDISNQLGPKGWQGGRLQRFREHLSRGDS